MLFVIKEHICTYICTSCFNIVPFDFYIPNKSECNRKNCSSVIRSLCKKLHDCLYFTTPPTFSCTIIHKLLFRTLKISLLSVCPQNPSPKFHIHVENGGACARAHTSTIASTWMCMKPKPQN